MGLYTVDTITIVVALEILRNESEEDARIFLPLLDIITTLEFALYFNSNSLSFGIINTKLCFHPPPNESLFPFPFPSPKTPSLLTLP